MKILNNLNIEIEEFGTSAFRVISHPVWFTSGREEDIMKEIVEFWDKPLDRR